MGHEPGYIHVDNQLELSKSETIISKHNFEQLSMDNDVVIYSYLFNYGIFVAKSFPRYIYEHVQKIHYYGVNTHHKNGVSERSIFAISSCIRSLLIHSGTCWKSVIWYTILLLIVNYAAYMYNHIPSTSNVAPTDVFHGNIFSLHKLCIFHVWGCLLYVLDPKISNC